MEVDGAAALLVEEALRRSDGPTLEAAALSLGPNGPAPAAALAWARARARDGLADAELRRDDELSPACHEMELAGEVDGAPAVRRVRLTVAGDRLLIAQATAAGDDPDRSALEAFVASVRPVARVDGRILEEAAEDEAMSGATLGTGEHLTGSAGDYEDGAVSTSSWRMPRSEFRASDEDYLRRPALASYPTGCKLYPVRRVELTLSEGHGVARTFCARDGDDVLLIHERITVNAEGYRAEVIELRNRALDPKHVEYLFADR